MNVFKNVFQKESDTTEHPYIDLYERREKKNLSLLDIIRTWGNRRLGDRRVVWESFTLNLITLPYNIRQSINMHWHPK